MDNDKKNIKINQLDRKLFKVCQEEKNEEGNLQLISNNNDANIQYLSISEVFNTNINIIEKQVFMMKIKNN